MGKDPAFLFYPGDYLGGTMGYTHVLHGAYILSLIYQFQNGHFTEEEILPIAGESWKVIKRKFLTDEVGLYYNQRLDIEIKKRKEYSLSRSENQKKRWEKKNICNTHVVHMENENRNENRNEDRDVKQEEGSGGKPKKQAFIPPDIGEFKKYCEEHQHYGIAQKAFDYYSAANWHDGKGNPVRNWKQKLIAVWFKDENKDPPPQIIRPKVLTPQQQWERDNPDCYKNRPSVAPLIKGLADALSMPQLNEPMRKK